MMTPTGRPSITRPTVFVGLGLQHPGASKIELIDDQVMPVQGVGRHTLKLAGIGTRLQAGDTVGLVHQRSNSFFLGSGTRLAEYAVPASGMTALPLGD
ncbi:MAG: hypothetical protein SVU69_10530 [Pseudomonadota bacterium]|nr:hypothetical protein [Pseudomonadota bacterium]